MMKKRVLLLLLIAFVFIISGCEQSSDVSEFPYDAKIVVNCVIQAGRVIDKIYISRTLPVPVNYSDDVADLKNASVAIQTKDTLLVYKYTDRFTYSASGLVAKQGETYTLLVQWQDKFAIATTTVPRIGIAGSPAMKQEIVNGKERKYLEAEVQQRGTEVYGGTWITYYSLGPLADESRVFEALTAKGGGNKVLVRSAFIPENLLGGTYKFGLRLHSYDPQFHDYFSSQSDNQVSGNIYLRANTNIKWNVRGDGIGMFIAKTDTVLRTN